MMLFGFKIWEIALAFIAALAAIVSIYEFYCSMRKDKTGKRARHFVVMILLAICLVVGGGGYTTMKVDESRAELEAKVKREQAAREEKARKEMKEEARKIALSIVVSGAEEPSEYLGNLSAIVEFYGQYKKKYPEKYKLYSGALKRLQELVYNELETSGDVSYPISGKLRGFVEAGDDDLDAIAYN